MRDGVRKALEKMVMNQQGACGIMQWWMVRVYMGYGGDVQKVNKAQRSSSAFKDMITEGYTKGISQIRKTK